MSKFFKTTFTPLIFNRILIKYTFPERSLNKVVYSLVLKFIYFFNDNIQLPKLLLHLPPFKGNRLHFAVRKSPYIRTFMTRLDVLVRENKNLCLTMCNLVMKHLNTRPHTEKSIVTADMAYKIVSQILNLALHTQTPLFLMFSDRKVEISYE